MLKMSFRLLLKIKGFYVMQTVFHDLHLFSSQISPFIFDLLPFFLRVSRYDSFMITLYVKPNLAVEKNYNDNRCLLPSFSLLSSFFTDAIYVFLYYTY